MPNTSTQLDEDLIESYRKLMSPLPLAWILITADGTILSHNPRTVELLGLQLHGNFQQWLKDGQQEKLAQLLASTSEMTFDLMAMDGCERKGSFQASEIQAGVFSVTLLALKEEDKLAQILEANDQPERKFLHELSNALTTTLGYSELISLSFEEHPILSGEALSSVQHYHKEVYTGLRRTDQLIKERKSLRRSLDVVPDPITK